MRQKTVENSLYWNIVDIQTTTYISSSKAIKYDICKYDHKQQIQKKEKKC